MFHSWRLSESASRALTSILSTPARLPLPDIIIYQQSFKTICLRLVIGEHPSFNERSGGDSHDHDHDDHPQDDDPQKFTH